MTKAKPARTAIAFRRARLVAIVGAAAMMSTAAWVLDACKAAVSDGGPSNIEGDTTPAPPIEVAPTSEPKTAAPTTDSPASTGETSTGETGSTAASASPATAHPAPTPSNLPRPSTASTGTRKKGPPHKSTIIYE